MSTMYTDTDNKPPASRPSPIFAVLRRPAYLLLWSAQFTSGIAGFFNYVAVAWLTLTLTRSPLAVGTVLAAASIPAAVLLLLGGAVSDRLSPRTTMLGAGVARGAVMAVTAALALGHSIQMWELYAAAVLVGTTTAFFYPASTSMVPRILESEQFEAGNALLNVSRTVAIVLGPALAGVIVAWVGAGWALAVDAAASIIAGLLVAPLPAATARAKKPGAGALADIRDGVVKVWNDVPLRAALLVVAVLNFFALGAIEVGLPVLANQKFAQGAIALGTAFGAWGLGSTVGSIGAASRPSPSHLGWGVIGVVAVMGAGIAAMGFAPNLPVLLAVMAVVGAVEGAGTTYLFSWMQRRTDPSMQGRVMSLALLSSVGFEPIALAIAGGLATRYLGLLFVASAAAVELTAIGAALSREVRRM